MIVVAQVFVSQIGLKKKDLNGGHGPDHGLSSIKVCSLPFYLKPAKYCSLLSASYLLL
jgi:hypothetical protein